MKRPPTDPVSWEHRALAKLHRQMARDAQSPAEKNAHRAAARQHELAARDPTLADEAQRYSEQAQAETQLRMKYARVLRERVPCPGRRPRGRRPSR